MSTNNFLGTGPPQFSGENYHIWAIKMKSYLMALSLWEAVEDDAEPEPLGADPTMSQIKAYEEKKAKKPRALTCLHSALSEDIFTRIMTCKTPKEVWEKLKDEFEGNERVKAVKLLTLKREFETLKMRDRELVKEYSSKLMDVVNKIRLLGEEFSDVKVVEKILVSLPARFESKVSAIEESCDLKTLTVTELISKLQAYEQRTQIRDDDDVEGAFQAKQKGKQSKKDVKKPVKENTDKGKCGQSSKEQGRRGKFPLCRHCQRTNHKEEDCWFKGKPPIQCRFCKRMGHIEKHCRHKQKQLQEEPLQQTNFMEEEEESTTASLFLATQQTHEGSKYTWFIDSGCTCHMAKDKELFSTLDKTVTTKVKLGNGQIVEAQGKGSVLVQTKEGTKVIHDVLFVPSLTQNLLSVAQMLKNAYSLVFKSMSCSIYDQKNVLVVKLPMVDKCFPSNWRYTDERVNVAREDESKLWHCRYGHCSYTSLIQLRKQDLVKCLPEVRRPENVCGSCQMGKQHREPLPAKATWRANEKL